MWGFLVALISGALMQRESAGVITAGHRREEIVYE